MIDTADLPHFCETAEVAGALATLTRAQRRALRSYVFEVELGETSKSAWLAAHSLVHVWYRKGAKARYEHCAAFQQALKIYLTAALRWSTAEDQRMLVKAQKRMVRGSLSAADRLVEQVEADFSDLLKVVERWTANPLPSEEIIEEANHPDEHGQAQLVYRVRGTVLDTDKLKDPRYARLIRKFTDSPKAGLSVELYDAQKAAFGILDRAGVETATKGSEVNEVIVKQLAGVDIDAL